MRRICSGDHRPPAGAEMPRLFNSRATCRLLTKPLASSSIRAGASIRRRSSASPRRTAALLMAAALLVGSDAVAPCGFLTREPNPLLAPLHPKAMPAIRQPEDYDRWLYGETDDACGLAPTTIQGRQATFRAVS